jgi:hypothetical protein
VQRSSNKTSDTPTLPCQSLPQEEISHAGFWSSAKRRSVSQASSVSSQPLDNMLRVVTAVQQIMTEFNGSLSEEENIVAITKIVLNLMKQIGH